MRHDLVIAQRINIWICAYDCMSMGECMCICDLILLACECIENIINELCNRKILQCVITWRGRETNTQFDLSGQEVEFKEDNGQGRQREEVTRKDNNA